VSFSAAATEISGLAGFEIAQCIVDSGFSLALRRAQQYSTLRIESLFRLKLDGEWELDPGGDRALLCPALNLIGRVIESAKLVKSGELDLALSGDAWLLAYSGRQLEAWTLSLPDNTLIVSGIEGEVSVFRERTP
jgi:hypothetical protein